MTPDDTNLQPRRTPRQVRAELTRQRILAAAAHVFAEHGYAAGTTNRIAERAGVSIGSLYQYYPSKDAILVELFARHMDRGKPASAEPAGSLAEELQAIVQASIEAHQDDPQLLHVLMEQALRWPDVLTKITEQYQDRVVEIRDLLDRYPEVDVANTTTAAHLLITTVEMGVHWLSAAEVDQSSLEQEMITMLTRYLTGGP
ncbi:TetR/AcrR family transcriptional regulator [Actinoplanes awajinensis]|uniref:TetR/AcrR family transcriptional regulator n=1 Tax=Actinoplanes awajinensis TaxID=135946 RepID=UPI000A048727|nr:TetR/AcrR family transcriptional regulator [Actinoplanes awajinensis]